MTHKHPSGMSTTLVVVVVVVVAVVVGVVFALQNDDSNAVVNNNIVNAANINTATTVDTSSWVSYENAVIGFRVDQPATFVVLNEPNNDGTPRVWLLDEEWHVPEVENPSIRIYRVSPQLGETPREWAETQIESRGYEPLQPITEIETGQGLHGSFYVDSIVTTYSLDAGSDILVFTIGHYSRNDVASIGKAMLETLILL